jgi:hypothetical protein
MSSSTSNFDSAWRRFFWLAAGTAMAITAVLYGFVVIVDPWDALPWSPRLDRAPVTSNQRFTYPALARSHRFDSAVFGTSTSRLLRPASLNQSLHGHFANLAMNDATPYEQMRLMEVFLRAHPAAKNLVLGIDKKWCQTGDTTPKLTPRPFPDWMYGERRWRGYREMLNMYAIQEAGKEFGVLLKFKKEDQGRDGYTIFVPPDDKYDASRAAAHLREDGLAPLEIGGSGPPASWRFSALDDLRIFLAGMNQQTETVLFFVPYNRVRLPPSGTPSAALWDECKHRTVALANEFGHVTVIDFMLPSPITNDDLGYWDSQHYRVAVADRVARGLASGTRGDSSPDYQVLHLPAR